MTTPRDPARRVRLTRLDGDAASAGEAVVAEEVPVAFVYGARTHAVMMCTPLDLEDLAVGFTVSEEIVARPADVGGVRVDRHARGVELRIEVPVADADRLAERGRSIPGRTGCGLCGVEAIADAVRAPRLVESSLVVSPDALWRAGRELEAGQALNAETRAVHAAAWCMADGEIRVLREDVGRHNALDKVFGALVRSGVDPSTGFAVVTSRASFELVQKAAVAGIPLLAAVSRPTGLAITMAERCGVTLVGVLRGEGASVYSGDRVRAPRAPDE